MAARGMKRSKALSLLIILGVTALLLIGCGKKEAAASEGDTAGAVYELTFSHHWPAKHKVETVMVQGWAKAIEEATGGRVKIVSYPGETLMPAAEAYEGVVQGVADIGLSSYGYTRGRFPVIETFLLPGINAKSSEALSLAAMELIEKLNPEEIQNTKQLWSFGSGPMDLMTKKPIRKMEDMKGMPLGVPGEGADSIAALGGAPVSMPMSEWYEALQKGVIQGGVAAVFVTTGFRLGEVTADYVTSTPFLPQNMFFCVMNKNKWDSLPKDIQETITKVTKDFYSKTVPMLWDQENKAALRAIREKKPVEYIKLPEQEAARWIRTIEGIQQTYAASLEAKGLPGKEILESVKEAVAKYNKQCPDVDYSN